MSTAISLEDIVGEVRSRLGWMAPPPSDDEEYEDYLDACFGLIDESLDKLNSPQIKALRTHVMGLEGMDFATFNEFWSETDSYNDLWREATTAQDNWTTSARPAWQSFMNAFEHKMIRFFLKRYIFDTYLEKAPSNN